VPEFLAGLLLMGTAGLGVALLLERDDVGGIFKTLLP